MRGVSVSQAIKTAAIEGDDEPAQGMDITYVPMAHGIVYTSVAASLIEKLVDSTASRHLNRLSSVL
jgi:hypothetical protein